MSKFTPGWDSAWGEAKNTYLQIFFEMGLIGVIVIISTFWDFIRMIRLRWMPPSFYAALVLVTSSFFQTTYVYASIAYLWILVLAILYIDLYERRIHEN